jgi:hypothetical protein
MRSHLIPAALVAAVLTLGIGSTTWSPTTALTGHPASAEGAVPRSTIEARYGTLGPEVAVRPNDRTMGTAGSGCLPRNNRRLPDGIWMVDVTAFRAVTLTVDLVCYSTDESGHDVHHDFHIANDNPLLRTMPLHDEAKFFLLTTPPIISVVEPEPTETRVFDDPAEAATFAFESGDATPLAWLLVRHGKIVEVYSPALTSA